MRTFVLASTTAICISFCLASVGWARQIENWPYERLFKESDLVVIAGASSSDACEDKIEDKNWQHVEIRAVNTTFEVKAVLQGKAPDAVKVLHFRLDSGVKLENGPLLVSFRSETTIYDMLLEKGGLREKVVMGPPEYMLFLERRADGRYEPVSGRIDPARTVRVLYEEQLLPTTER